MADTSTDTIGVKTSALAIVPSIEVWPAIQALRLAYDRQVRVWPPHVNLLYPFVPERDFQDAAQRLAEAAAELEPLTLRFSRKGHFGTTAFLAPECPQDPGLQRLYATCKSLFPDLATPHECFNPHLTIGQFKNAQECKAFLESCPHVEIETKVSCLCLLARDSMQHPFRTPLRIRLGETRAEAVEQGGMEAYVVSREESSRDNTASREKERSSFYQVDDHFVRLVFKVETECLSKLGGAAAFDTRCTLFVVDQSSSMGSAYSQVKAAVRYMTQQCSSDKHDLGFVLYAGTARLASAEEVLCSEEFGSTSFAAAFESVKEFISGRPCDTAITIVFMTDGQDTTSKDLPKAKLAFQEFLDRCGRRTTIHAIGFTSSSHRSFLEEVCCMGTSEGMYRYAEQGSSLEERFAEMFDFADLNAKIKLHVGSQELQVDATETGNGEVSFDLVLAKTEFQEDLPCSKGHCRVVLESGVEVLLEPAKLDPMFAIRCVDETSISSQKDLEWAQETLNKVQLHKVPKANREEATDARSCAQGRLDKYHQLFAAGARTSLVAQGGNLAAELSSLRHEVTFSKARRARAMAQRAMSNASTAKLMEQLLSALPPVLPADLAALESMELTCALSGDTPADILHESCRDFFVFPLRVRRPEDVIDAPIVLDVQQFLPGVYSNEAFRAGTKHAVHSTGPEQAHGGFLGSTKHPVALGDDVGLFRGPDGQMMNACLPLYLSEAHFARIKLQIKPILGYFFTLDPLGYKGDQTIALFQILGTMLCARLGSGVAGIAGFSGTWADWLVTDFTKLCSGLQALAKDYLAEGGYTGSIRGDLLDDFLAGPKGRTKECLPSMGVLIGWAAASAAEITPRFHMAFAEELWRRNFTTLYKGQPREPIMETLEQLLYGPSSDDDHQGNIVAGVTRNVAGKDRQFALWGKYVRGDLPKKQAEDLRKKFGTVGPELEGLLSSDAEYKPRQPLEYAEAPEFFDAVVAAELAKISKANSFAAALYDGRPQGVGFKPCERRLMLIQALRFVGNDAMNEAVAKGSYLNTFDCFARDDGAARICDELHQRFEHRRREKLDSFIEQRNALLTARRIVATEDMDAFAGRIAVSCPTRGGSVFNNVIALLASCGDCSTSATVPHLRSKVTAMLTGKMGDTAVIAEGSSWIHCPLETARKMQAVIGDEAFVEIELKMYGTWGHVYRSSDIPNRHGHCVSNPNRDLVQSFDGFRLGSAASAGA